MSSILVLNERNGRFGNKLFQVAATIATAKKNNLEYGFCGNPFESKYFKNEFAPIVLDIPQKKYYQERFNYYDIKLNESYEFKGYYQSEKFFKNAIEEVLKLYTFDDTIVNNLLQSYPNIMNSCSIHVRRGDYLNMPDYHTVIPLDYYKKAIECINNKHIYVFSDDIEWCKANFKFINAEFLSLNMYEDFILMSLCRDNIICNSTFSWWAAYLNKNKSKKIVAPEHKKWFGKCNSHLNTTDIYPENWTQIDYEI